MARAAKRGRRQSPKNTPQKSNNVGRSRMKTEKTSTEGSSGVNLSKPVQEISNERLGSVRELADKTAASQTSIRTGEPSLAETPGGQLPVRGTRSLRSTRTRSTHNSAPDATSLVKEDFMPFVIDTKPNLHLNAAADGSDSDDDDDDCVLSDMPFVIDKVGISGKYTSQADVRTLWDENKQNDVDAQPQEEDVKKRTPKPKLQENKESLPSLEAPCEIDVGIDLGDGYINLDGEASTSGKAPVQNVLLKSRQDRLIKKSVLTPDFEKRHSIPPYQVAYRQLKKQRKKEAEQTKGDGWFGMKAAEMTEELRNDIKIIRMRSTLDPKRFYKTNDSIAIPKFVQVGKVVDSPVDFYHSRLTKKQRKQTLVEELLADADARRYNKRKYIELQDKFNSFTRGGKKKKFGKKNAGKKR